MIETYADPEHLARAAAEATAEALAAAISQRGHASLVGTGGRSPAPVYDLLAANDAIAWDKVAVTLSDDRFVPPDSPDSNERLVRERLLVGAAARATFTPISVSAAIPIRFRWSIRDRHMPSTPVLLCSMIGPIRYFSVCLRALASARNPPR